MKTAAALPMALWAALLMLIGLSAAPAEESDAQRAVLQVEQEIAKALRANDAAALKTHLTDDWHLVDASGRVMTFAEVERLLTSGAVKFTSYEVGDLAVRVHGDAAIVIGRDTTTGEADGSSFSSTDRFTDVFVRQNGVWKLASSHLSPITQ